MPARRPAIIGHHLIWMLYGHWLSNDPRGSGSEAVRDPKFRAFGEAHFGRKPRYEQPSRAELRKFYRKAAPLLEFPLFWIDEAKRQAIGELFGTIVAERQYTVWACAILSNHVHMVIRRHRDDALTLWRVFAEAMREKLRQHFGFDAMHPVLAARPYKVFLRTPHEVRTRVAYVERNPEKEGLPAQRYDFVQPYNSWPFHTAL
jgi:REP element-mobilizing transposase RayT